ncbi:MAG: hypothetical protein H6987_07970 [Pseudomonadales bacterium]|nr:hypothetical protein [Pseudomonadales bacterium]
MRCCGCGGKQRHLVGKRPGRLLYRFVFVVIFALAFVCQLPLERNDMATAKKKAPAKKRAAPKKAAAKKSPARKKAAAAKPAKGNFFSNALNDARDQWDDFVDSAKLKAKQVAAQEKVLEKKAELAAKAEIDKVKHLAAQADKWMKARIKADTKKINALEKKLAKQVRDAERKLRAQAKAAEKKANKRGKVLKKKLDTGKKALEKAPAQVKAKVAAARKKAAAPGKKAPARKKAAPRAKARAKK